MSTSYIPIALDNFPIVGLTPEWRTVAQLFRFNKRARVAERRQLEGC